MTPAIGSSDIEQVAAVDVKLGAQLVQLGKQALGQVDRQATAAATSRRSLARSRHPRRHGNSRSG
jgi:hypothetical protein